MAIAKHQPSTRERLLEAAVEHLAKEGPARFKPHEICFELGVSKALVNYHFGNRDGLIAEAMVCAYEEYVDALAEAIAGAGEDPMDKIIAWVDRQIAWTTEHPGIAIALNFPYEATEQPLNLPPELDERLRASGARNQDQVYACVLELARHERGEEVDPSEVNLMVTSFLLGWLTLGISVWQAGRHLPTAEYHDYQHTLADTVRNRIRLVLRAGVRAR